MSANETGSGMELKIVGRVLNTIGVVFLSICVALTGALYEDVGALERTAVGLAIAAAMVVGGELLSRKLKSSWFPTTVMSSGYALAYFFIYSAYYVPGLHLLDSPYAVWILGPVLGLIGTWHGTKNASLRWFSSVFTLTVTGHAMFHALTSTAAVTAFGATVSVPAIACFLGMLWCASLSTLYKKLELRYTYGKSTEETANWLLHRVLHEVYFVLAALSAMALPLFLSNFQQAPLWWSVQAPILLALNWRNGNVVKHLVVGGMWLAAAVTLLVFHQPLALPVLLSVPAAGLAMGLAYRKLKSNLLQEQKVVGYCAYVYVAVALAVVLPYFQFGLWDSMSVWMIEALVVSGLGLALRDRFVHTAGLVAGAAGLALFVAQFNTWTWGLVAPVVACSYALSVVYSRISAKGGWKETEFLPFGGDVVSVDNAANLETAWSWVGFASLLAASFLLIGQQSTVLWWAGEALTLIALGFTAHRVGFRVQGLVAYGLAVVKLVVWDMSGGHLSWEPETAFTLFRALQFGVVGGSTLLASFLYFREENRLKALAEKAKQPPVDGQNTPPAPPVSNDQNAN